MELLETSKDNEPRKNRRIPLYTSTECGDFLRGLLPILS